MRLLHYSVCRFCGCQISYGGKGRPQSACELCRKTVSKPSRAEYMREYRKRPVESLDEQIKRRFEAIEAREKDIRDQEERLNRLWDAYYDKYYKEIRCNHVWEWVLSCRVCLKCGKKVETPGFTFYNRDDKSDHH